MIELPDKLAFFCVGFRKYIGNRVDWPDRDTTGTQRFKPLIRIPYAEFFCKGLDKRFAILDTRRIRRLGIPDEFVLFGERGELLAELGLDAAGIFQACREMVDEQVEV